eukprot:10303555-Alexandrium_andersonii.AAC.1
MSARTPATGGVGVRWRRRRASVRPVGADHWCKANESPDQPRKACESPEIVPPEAMSARTPAT